MSYQPNLQNRYKDEIVPALMEQFQYDSIMEVPRLVKVCINQGVGAATQDKKLVDAALDELTKIAGQKAVPTKARKSVSNFKLREGMTIGARVTLRRDRMWEFIERLVAVALPRVRDFRGINDKSFDGRGNYSMGISDQTIFPEINLDKVEYRQGMNVTFVTSARDDAGARRLLTELGMPLKRSEDEEGK